MARPFGSTRNWAIAWRGIASAPLGLGEVNVGWFLLWPTGLTWGCPVIFSGAGIGSGVQGQPFVAGPFTSFNTMSGGAAGGGNCLPSDFNSFGSVLFSSAGPGAGGIVSLNFYSIDHSPNPIICSGVPVGAGAAFGWTPGRFTAMPAISIDIDVGSGARASLYAGDAGGFVLTDSSEFAGCYQQGG